MNPKSLNCKDCGGSESLITDDFECVPCEYCQWLNVVRSIAFEKKVRNEGETDPMPTEQIDNAFDHINMRGYFESDLTPEEAFEEEMEAWADAATA